MRKKIIALILLIFSVLAAAMLTACDGDTKPDTTPPVITVENFPLTIDYGVYTKMPVATAFDDVDGDISDRIKLTVYMVFIDSEENETVGKYHMKDLDGNGGIEICVTDVNPETCRAIYTVSDSAGNEAVFTKIFTVVDKKAPVIELKTLMPSSAVAGNSFTIPGATAMDDRDKGMEGYIYVSAYLYGPGNQLLHTYFEEIAGDEKNTIDVDGSAAGNELRIVYSVTDSSFNTETLSWAVNVRAGV